MREISRKDFLKHSALGFAGLSFIPSLTQAGEKENKMRRPTEEKRNYTLKNVRLETGFDYRNDEIVGTKTELFSIEIANGKIKKISQDQTDASAIDMEGLLMLPSFRDMHIHLDKTLYADEWRAVSRSGGVKDMIALEQRILPEMLKKATYKAEKLIELLQSYGSAFARSHVNIEPTSKLDSLRNLKVALEHKKDTFEAELVAFPQHGLYYTDSLPYMKEAAKMDIDFIGGLDPTTIDGAMERSIDTTIQLALDHAKGIDIHLHESGKTGLETIRYVLSKVNENPTLKGKTYISHAFALGRLDNAQQERIAEELAAAQVGIISTVPFGGLVMPIPTLLKHNVKIMTGNDSIVDHWNTMGTGSVLQKANLAAQLYGQVTEFGLSRMLKLATAGPVPLNDNGTQQWPKVGDEASLVLIEASCSAEAVSRMSPVRSLVHKGNIVY
ncbi:MAG TPA: amidohydrolase family protein [Candidatus Sphingobacterium stercorigallinarum]|nr:amidohydrolase family protein [Candidatus Sphingobacterium stercorigallinarum]